MSNNYDAEVDLSKRNSSHTLIVEMVGRDKNVLDVGTATGFLAEVLAERGCVVTGIEIDTEAARQAEGRCERVVVGDVETLDLSAELDEESYDVIIFGDVLEHLKDPLRTLVRLKHFLKPEGYVIASIPNVAHGSVRLALLQGRFEYQPMGLLDNTHLRFYTRKSMEQLFTDAGFLIGKLEHTKRQIFDTEVEVDRDSVPGAILQRLEADPEAKMYQFVLTAHPFGNAGTAARLSNHARLLSERLAARDMTIRELRRELRRLGEVEQQLTARDRMIHELSRKLRRLEELERMLNERTEQLEERKQEATELRQQVAQLNRRLANARTRGGTQ